MDGRKYLVRPTRRCHYRITPLAKRYACALLSLPLSAWAVWNATQDTATALAAFGGAWIAAGVFLSRTIERHLRWNDNLVTLATAARDKLSFILSWPVVTPQLIWRMFVVRYL